jgi:hypothetical protein
VSSSQQVLRIRARLASMSISLPASSCWTIPGGRVARRRRAGWRRGRWRCPRPAGRRRVGWRHRWFGSGGLVAIDAGPVGAGAEGTSGPGEHDHPDTGDLGMRFHRAGCFGEHGRGQRVQRVRMVEGDTQNSVDLFTQDGRN